MYASLNVEEKERKMNPKQADMPGLLVTEPSPSPLRLRFLSQIPRKRHPRLLPFVLRKTSKLFLAANSQARSDAAPIQKL